MADKKNLVEVAKKKYGYKPSANTVRVHINESGGVTISRWQEVVLRNDEISYWHHKGHCGVIVQIRAKEGEIIKPDEALFAVYFPEARTGPAGVALCHLSFRDFSF